MYFNYISPNTDCAQNIIKTENDTIVYFFRDKLNKKKTGLGMVAHSCNPSTL